MGDFDPPEEVVIATVDPRYDRDAPHILERWAGYKYVEVGRAHSEEEALKKAQKLADKLEVSVRVRLKHDWDD